MSTMAIRDNIRLEVKRCRSLFLLSAVSCEALTYWSKLSPVKIGARQFTSILTVYKHIKYMYWYISGHTNLECFYFLHYNNSFFHVQCKQRSLMVNSISYMLHAYIIVIRIFFSKTPFSISFIHKMVNK